MYLVGVLVVGLAVGAGIYAVLRRRGLPWWGAAVPALPVLFDVFELQLEHMVASDVLFYALVTAVLGLLCWWDRPPLVVAVIVGVRALGLIPPVVGLSMVALVPTVATFGAVVASLISSRVRTYNAAQQITSLVLMPVFGAFVFLAIQVQTWGPVGPLVAVAVTAAIDVALILAGAATWRREEVLARR